MNNFVEVVRKPLVNEIHHESIDCYSEEEATEKFNVETVEVNQRSKKIDLDEFCLPCSQLEFRQECFLLVDS